MQSTQEIANQLVNYCRQGQFEKAVQELYSPDIVSIEMAAMGPMPQRIEGMDAYRQKSEAWQAQVQAIHGVEVSEPIVAGNHFSCKMGLDITMKGKERSKDEEICVYEVKDGKIVTERFFYPLG